MLWLLVALLTATLLAIRNAYGVLAVLVTAGAVIQQHLRAGFLQGGVCLQGLGIELGSRHQRRARVALRGRGWRCSGCWRPSLICAVISAGSW